jgi:hypothetical protein
VFGLGLSHSFEQELAIDIQWHNLEIIPFIKKIFQINSQEFIIPFLKLATIWLELNDRYSDI